VKVLKNEALPSGKQARAMKKKQCDTGHKGRKSYSNESAIKNDFCTACHHCVTLTLAVA
jgi:hypothetical protein